MILWTNWKKNRLFCAHPCPPPPHTHRNTELLLPAQVRQREGNVFTRVFPLTEWEGRYPPRYLWSFVGKYPSLACSSEGGYPSQVCSQGYPLGKGYTLPLPQSQAGYAVDCTSLAITHKYCLVAHLNTFPVSVRMFTHSDTVPITHCQGCHGTGKTGNLKVHVSRQGNTRNLLKLLSPAIRRMGEGNSFSLFTSGGGYPISVLGR